MTTPTVPAVRLPPGAGKWVVLACVVVIIGLAVLLSRSRASDRKARLALDSTAAAADSTRRVLTGTVNAWQRRAVQATLERDSLDRELGLRPATRIVTIVRLDTVRLEGSGPTTSDPRDSVRVGTFDLREGPVALNATARLPRAPARGTLTATVVVDSIPLDIRLGCGDKVNGIRPASATVTGPAWGRIGLSNVRADPDVCNAASEFRIAGGVPWAWLPATALAFLLVGIVAF